MIEIESSTAKADRESVVALRSTQPIDRHPALGAAQPPQSAAPASKNIDFYSDQTPPRRDADTDREPAVSRDDLCNALLTSAQDNDLPVPFFANLLWQESGLRNDVVSSKGALGIAQFMPETAEESGLDDPFDPLQAIPASARFLRALRLQFGNLGFAAAAYNAGARRVSQWLEHRRKLPRETRGYVANVTGRSVDKWRTTPPDDAALTFVRRLPCRGLPAFAALEQAQSDRARLEHAQLAQAQVQQVPIAGKTATAAHGKRERVADRKHLRTDVRHEALRAAADNRHSGKRG
ncbi:MAG: lytic transglycosylase domain-containing protein [Xanthobacteraceae bacterium]